MLKIWKNCDEIRDIHLKYCEKLVELRIEKFKRNGLTGRIKQDLLDLLDYASKNMINILGGNINELEKIHKYLIDNNALYRRYSKRNNRDEKAIVKNIFDYKYFRDRGIRYNEEFKQWDAYELVKAIGLITCPYCNEHTIHTVYHKDDTNNHHLKGKIRAELDHFLPQNEYPLFALSFYNLIPVCHSCNLTKSTKKIRINPYDDYYGEKDRFKMKYGINYLPLLNDHAEDFEIEFTSEDKSKIDQTRELCIKERYSQYKETVLDIQLKSQWYNKIYLESIKELIPGVGKIDQSDVFRLLFNAHHLENEYHKRPLSKLINDILKQLNKK